MAKIKLLAIVCNTRCAKQLRLRLSQLPFELIEVIQEQAEALRILKATQPDVVLVQKRADYGQESKSLGQKISEHSDTPLIYISSPKTLTSPDESSLAWPPKPAALKTAIEEAISRQKIQAPPAIKEAPLASLRKAVFVKEGNCLVKLLLQDIMLAEAYDKYCYVYTRQKKHLLNIQLKDLLQHLPRELFLQVHRSWLVNLEAIERIIPRQHCLEVAGRQVPVSKSFKAALYAQLTTL